MLGEFSAHIGGHQPQELTGGQSSLGFHSSKNGGPGNCGILGNGILGITEDWSSNLFSFAAIFSVLPKFQYIELMEHCWHKHYDPRDHHLLRASITNLFFLFLKRKTEGNFFFMTLCSD